MPKQYHIAVSEGQAGKYVLLPGDPGRVAEIAGYLDGARFVAQNREFVTYTGALDGEPVSVTSTGIGGPSAAIAMEELIKCGARVFIRVGTCGGIHTDVVGGDLVIASAMIRGDGTSREYLPPEYPAAADFGVTAALKKSAEDAGLRCHVGVVQSKDSFYGQHAPETMPVSAYLAERRESYVKAGCLASEMEAAALACVALARGVKFGCVLTALWNRERGKRGMSDPEYRSSDRAITCAVGALRILIGEGG